MRYARDTWEKERDGWRAVVQLNIVRSIMSIIKVVESALNGDVETDDIMEGEDDETTLVPSDDEAEKFTDGHRLLVMRLAPLRAVEAELKHRLGAGTESVRPAWLLPATPFDGEYPTLKRNLPEFAVRSWKDVIDLQDEYRDPDSGKKEYDSATLTMASCRDDMRALWDDKDVREALRRRKVILHDSAGL